MWATNSNGSISLAVVDMLGDKDLWNKAIRDYAIQEGGSL